MTREVQGVVLLLLGGTVLRITFGGQYLFYVKEGLRPGLLGAGAILVALGAWALWDAWRDDGHGHGHRGPRAAWLLLLPVLAVYVIAPPALGSFSAARATSNAGARAPDSAVDPLPPGDPVPLTLADYVTRSVWDRGRTLSGREVSLTGFVTPDPAGGWWLTRLGLTCCAADAVAYRVKVLGVADLPADTWVTVEGAWASGGGTEDPKAIPRLRVTSVNKVPEPANPYE